MLEHLRVQRKQFDLVGANEKDGKLRLLLDLNNSQVIPCAQPIYTEHWYAPIPMCSPGAGVQCRRAAADGQVSAEQCARLAAATDSAMENLFHQGGATSLVPEAASEPRLGAEALAAIRALRAASRAAVEAAHGLPPGSLHDSGALLTRLVADAPDDAWELNRSHVYWNAHVDKANIPSYDWSALLYLRAPSEGGAFAFVDRDADRVVEPRCGRLLSFSSGLENLHRVERVVRGSRLVLAMWFTCSPRHSYSEYAHERRGTE